MPESGPDFHSEPILSAVGRAVATRGYYLQEGIFFGATDARFLRRFHHNTRPPIKVVNFSPMRDTPVLLHDHDEFLSQEIFLQGILIFKDIVSDIAMAALDEE